MVAEQRESAEPSEAVPSISKIISEEDGLRSAFKNASTGELDGARVKMVTEAYDKLETDLWKVPSAKVSSYLEEIEKHDKSQNVPPLVEYNGAVLAPVKSAYDKRWQLDINSRHAEAGKHIDKVWQENGEGSIGENARTDAQQIMGDNPQHAANHDGFQKHLYSAMKTDGTPGVSAYADEVNKALKERPLVDGSTMQIRIGSVNMCDCGPGNNGSYEVYLNERPLTQGKF